MIIRTTIAELQKEAETRYKRWLASLPEPKVINVEAVVLFEAPRTLELGGVGYRAPPLSYREGLRVFVAANALRDLRLAEAPAEFVETHLETARRLLTGSLVPISRLRRLTRWTRAFAQATAEDVETLLRWLLAIPDDTPHPTPSRKAVTVDLLDGLVGFAKEFPMWLGPDGLPRTWAAYVYGSRYLSRARAREDLRRAMAGRAAGAVSKDYKSWSAEVREAAGWTDG